MDRQILIAGFGGQGVMLMGQMLAYSAMKKDYNVSWMPSYGPEQRGGTANCGVVISEQPVGSPVVNEPTECVAMNLPSLEKFADTVVPGGCLLINSSLADADVNRDDITILRIPASEEAEQLGEVRVANMIMLGALSEATSLLSVEYLKDMLSEVLPERRHGLIPLNEKALDRGRELAQKQLAVK